MNDEEEPSRRHIAIREPMSHAEQQNLVVFTDTHGEPAAAQAPANGSWFRRQAGQWKRQAGAFSSETLVLCNMQQVRRAHADGEPIRVVSVSRFQAVKALAAEALTAAPADGWGTREAEALRGAHVRFTLSAEDPTSRELQAVRRLQAVACTLTVEYLARGRRPHFRAVDQDTLQTHADAPVVRHLVGAAAEKRRRVAQPGSSFLVADLIPAGLIVLVGQPYCGKSTLVASLAATVAAGQHWLGLTTRGGSALIVCGERAESMRERTAAASRRLGLALGPTVLEVPWNLHGDHASANFKKLSEAVNIVGGVSLLVLDTFGSLTSGMPEADASAMSALMGRFHNLMSEHPGLSVLLVHHPLKNGQGVRGHGALVGSADTVLELAARKDMVVLTLQASNHLPAGARQHFRLTADPEGVPYMEHVGGGPSGVGAAPASSARDAAAAALLAAARAAGGPVHWPRLAEEAGIGKTALFSLLKELPNLRPVPGRRGHYVYVEGGDGVASV